MYALEKRHRAFIPAFAMGCVLASIYGFLAGTWPFGVVEAVWAAIALRRYRHCASADSLGAWGGARARLPGDASRLPRSR
jgi:hypothetical protein